MGIIMKWNPVGCLATEAPHPKKKHHRRSSKRAKDSGCQCDQYCGYSCVQSCNADPQCQWTNGECYNIALGTPGGIQHKGKCVPAADITFNPTISPTLTTPSLSPTSAPITSIPTEAPTFSPTTSTPTFSPTNAPICFHSSSTVRLETGDQKRLDELTYGERVLATDDSHNLVFSRVVHFTGAFPKAVGLGSKIFFQANGEEGTKDIILSPRHLILASQSNTSSKPDYIPAEQVQVGMYLHHMSVQLVKVTRVQTVEATGWYTPLTETGTIVVNDIIASCHTMGPHSLVKKFYWPLYWYYSWFPHKENEQPNPEEYQYYSVGFRRSVFGQLGFYLLNVVDDWMKQILPNTLLI